MLRLCRCAATLSMNGSFPLALIEMKARRLQPVSKSGPWLSHHLGATRKEADKMEESAVEVHKRYSGARRENARGQMLPERRMEHERSYM